MKYKNIEKFVLMSIDLNCYLFIVVIITYFYFLTRYIDIAESISVYTTHTLRATFKLRRTN